MSRAVFGECNKKETSVRVVKMLDLRVVTAMSIRPHNW
jgi:hypothetical protein